MWLLECTHFHSSTANWFRFHLTTTYDWASSFWETEEVSEGTNEKTKRLFRNTYVSRTTIDGHFYRQQLPKSLYAYTRTISSLMMVRVCGCASSNAGIINNPAQQCNAILSVCQRKLIVYIYSHILFAFKNDSVLWRTFSASHLTYRPSYDG